MRSEVITSPSIVTFTVPEQDSEVVKLREGVGISALGCRKVTLRGVHGEEAETTQRRKARRSGRREEGEARRGRKLILFILFESRFAEKKEEEKESI